MFWVDTEQLGIDAEKAKCPQCDLQREARPSTVPICESRPASHPPARNGSAPMQRFDRYGVGYFEDDIEICDKNRNLHGKNT